MKKIKIYNKDDNIRLYNGDCLDILDKLIEEGIKVGCIITDPPYGTTNCSHDKVINFKKMWERIKKIRNENSCIILFSAEPYTSDLVRSNKKEFKYKKFWKKDRPSAFLNAKRQPLRDIEEIVIFYKKQCTYNPIMTKGKPSHGIGISAGNAYEENSNKNNNYGTFKTIERLGDEKYPRQMMEYSRPHPPIHPTQKPVELIEDLVKTYSNVGDTILDFTMGSGSTGVACKNLNRKFIGIELDEKYFEIAVDRIKKSE